MVAATAYPNPVALLHGTDIEEAASRLNEAREWLDHIRVVEASIAQQIAMAEAESNGAEREVEKWKNVLSPVQHAREYAEQHVEMLTKKRDARAARRGRGSAR